MRANYIRDTSVEVLNRCNALNKQPMYCDPWKRYIFPQFPLTYVSREGKGRPSYSGGAIAVNQAKAKPNAVWCKWRNLGDILVLEAFVMS